MLVFLIGYMGCGKSSIGKPLARRLGMSFVDMDTEVEKQCGMSVGDLFACRGETHFREVEREVLSRLSRLENTVVATGGGTPCYYDNMEVMNRKGVTVYFKLSPQKLVSRLIYGKSKRPLLRDKTDEELLEFVTDALAKREETYEKAKLIISCDALSDDYVAEHVVMYVDQRDKFRI